MRVRGSGGRLNQLVARGYYGGPDDNGPGGICDRTLDRAGGFLCDRCGKKGEGEQQKIHGRCDAAELLGDGKRHLQYLEKSHRPESPNGGSVSGFCPWPMLRGPRFSTGFGCAETDGCSSGTLRLCLLSCRFRSQAGPRIFGNGGDPTDLNVKGQLKNVTS